MIRRFVLWGLLGVNLLAGAWLARHWVDRYGQPKSHAWVEPKAMAPDWRPQETSTAWVKAPDPLAFASLQERPLFSASRRPPPPPPPPSAASAPVVDPLASVHLFGVFAGEGGDGGALLRVSGKIQSVPKGGKIGPWTVASVSSTGIELESATGKRRLTVNTVPGLRAPAPVADGPGGAGPPPAPTAGSGAPRASGASARAQVLEERRRQRLEQSEAARAARAARAAGITN